MMIKLTSQDLKRGCVLLEDVVALQDAHDSIINKQMDLYQTLEAENKAQALQIKELEAVTEGYRYRGVEDRLHKKIKELDCRLLVESDNNRIAEHRIKELKNEIGKWLSHVTKMEDKLEMLTECNAIEGVDEASPFCYCQGCSNKAFIENSQLDNPTHYNTSQDSGGTVPNIEQYVNKRDSACEEAVYHLKKVTREALDLDEVEFYL